MIDGLRRWGRLHSPAESEEEAAAHSLAELEEGAVHSPAESEEGAAAPCLVKEVMG